MAAERLIVSRGGRGLRREKWGWEGRGGEGRGGGEGAQVRKVEESERWAVSWRGKRRTEGKLDFTFPPFVSIQRYCCRKCSSIIS